MSDARARPILMSGPMVRAILEGRKCQTRRVMKPQPVGVPWFDDDRQVWRDCWVRHAWRGASYIPMEEITPELRCPYGRPGDLLSVREAAWICPPRWTDSPANPMGPQRQEVAYKADDLRGGTAEAAADYKLKLTPSIHMPRWASRLTLELTDVRAQRVQEISEEDAEAEGVEPALLLHEMVGGAPDMYRRGFRALWQHLNAKRGYGWRENPWCWCLSFVAHPQNVDDLLEERRHAA